MAIAGELQIEPLPAAAAGDVATVTTVTDLVNEVYRLGEEGLWRPGEATRTTVEEITELIRAE